MYNIINNLVSEGKAVIMVSSELPEVMGMSDRIIVMHEGIWPVNLNGMKWNVKQL